MKSRNEADAFDYGFYSDCLSECVNSFGALPDLPIIKSHFDKISKYYSGGNVLDLGCGKARVAQARLRLSDEVYHSLDTDPCGTFTYRSVEEIPENKTFALVIANQVLEHLTLAESIKMVRVLQRHIKKGGYFIATVPNIAHPVRQHTNITHVTCWEYKALYALFKLCRFNVQEIARYSKRHPKGVIEKIVAYYVNRIYRIDWCDSILIVGQKSEAS
ncbi:MAG: methyltransferase domain-containing protein [Candidatus Omnitrophica bacterium]|nr:methyltransferase domain-containing protein [Candidatus Omnitrophota bacterium]